MRWYCQGCGHHHGHENCTAIRYDDNDAARKCGCQNNRQDQAA